MTRRGLSIALLLGLAACGPTDAQAGQAVLLAILPITIAGLLVRWLYALVWRPAKTVPPVGARGTALAIQVALAVAALPFLRWQPGTLEWLGIAIWGVGASYLVLLALALRLGVGYDVRWARVVVLVPWIFLGTPALVMALFGSTRTEADLWAFALLLPGYCGWVTAPVLLLLFGEAAIRAARARGRARRFGARVVSTRR